jgi:hypothetical protein
MGIVAAQVDGQTQEAREIRNPRAILVNRLNHDRDGIVILQYLHSLEEEVLLTDDADSLGRIDLEKDAIYVVIDSSYSDTLFPTEVGERRYRDDRPIYRTYVMDEPIRELIRARFSIYWLPMGDRRTVCLLPTKEIESVHRAVPSKREIDSLLSARRPERDVPPDLAKCRRLLELANRLGQDTTIRWGVRANALEGYAKGCMEKVRGSAGEAPEVRDAAYYEKRMDAAFLERKLSYVVNTLLEAADTVRVSLEKGDVSRGTTRFVLSELNRQLAGKVAPIDPASAPLEVGVPDLDTVAGLPPGLLFYFLSVPEHFQYREPRKPYLLPPVGGIRNAICVVPRRGDIPPLFIDSGRCVPLHDAQWNDAGLLVARGARYVTQLDLAALEYGRADKDSDGVSFPAFVLPHRTRDTDVQVTPKRLGVWGD